MLVEMRSIASITPYENNPRVNDAAVDAVAESIRQFGFRQPIVVDEQGVIIVGHTRLKAAIRLGMIEVPVHVARGLSPEQTRANFPLLIRKVQGMHKQAYRFKADLKSLGTASQSSMDLPCIRQ